MIFGFAFFRLSVLAVCLAAKASSAGMPDNYEGKAGSTSETMPQKKEILFVSNQDIHNTISKRGRELLSGREEKDLFPDSNGSDPKVETQKHMQPPKRSYDIKYLHLPFDPDKFISLKCIPYPPAQDMLLNYGKRYLLLKSIKNPALHYVDVLIDKSHQRMYVYLDDTHVYKWKVSTARRGYWTPIGDYRPYTLHRMHYSRKYHNSPMPWSVFFKGGFAIHGTNALRHLGRPASHGCVRLHPKNAKILYRLIRKYGMQNTLIYIRG